MRCLTSATRGHLYVAMEYVDGQPIVEDGVLVGPPHLAKLGEQLTPRS